MAKGKWKVFGNNVCGTKYYQVGRMRDVTGALHSGNVEYYGECTKDRDACEQLARELNKQEAQKEV